MEWIAAFASSRTGAVGKAMALPARTWGWEAREVGGQQFPAVRRGGRGFSPLVKVPRVEQGATQLCLRHPTQDTLLFTRGLG